MKKSLFTLIYLLSVGFYQKSTAQLSFTTPVNYTAGVNPQYITSADFNNDGKVDLAEVNATSTDLFIYLGYLYHHSSSTKIVAEFQDCATHRRRIELEDKTKVVASISGAKFVQFLCALTVLPWSIRKNRMNSTFFFQIVQGKTASAARN